MTTYYIYKLKCKDETVKDIYLGHTKNIETRMKCHKTLTNNPNNIRGEYPLYKRIRETNGWDNWTYEVLETLQGEKIDARNREDYYCNLLDPNLNVIRAYRTKQQQSDYYEKNSEWYKLNNKRAKLRYKNMCETIRNLKKENEELKNKLNKIGQMFLQS